MLKTTKWEQTEFEGETQLTRGWRSHWHAGTPGGHSVAQTLWVPATRASPADTENHTFRAGADRKHASFVFRPSVIMMHEVSNL